MVDKVANEDIYF